MSIFIKIETIVLQGFPFPRSYMLFWPKFSDVVTVRQVASTYTRHANTHPCSHLDASSRSKCWRYAHLRLRADSVRLHVEITSEITSLAPPSKSPITALPIIRCHTISAIRSVLDIVCHNINIYAISLENVANKFMRERQEQMKPTFTKILRTD